MSPAGPASGIPERPHPFLVEYLASRVRAARQAAVSSAGSVSMHVVGEGRWSLRLRDGQLHVTEGPADDGIIQVTLEAQDFVPLVVEAFRRAEARPPLDVGAARAFVSDAATADALRRLPGSVLFGVEDGDRLRRILVTPGAQQAGDFEDADCRVLCSMDDYLAVLDAREQPLQLLMAGRLRITGDVQLALALGGAFA